MGLGWCYWPGHERVTAISLRLFTLANGVDRREPRLDPEHLPHHAEGLILLTGGRDGPVSNLLLDGRRGEAETLLKDYVKWFGEGSVYVELQRNFLQGDAGLVQASVRLARNLAVPLVASNDVHYHDPERYRLQHALVASRLNTTMERALPHIKPNNHLSLKPPAQMTKLFKDFPEAILSTVNIAEQCEFNLATGLGYTLPEPGGPIRLHPRQLPQTPLLRGRPPPLRDRDAGGRGPAG